jgi:hypothetical protein
MSYEISFFSADTLGVSVFSQARHRDKATGWMREESSFDSRQRGRDFSVFLKV